MNVLATEVFLWSQCRSCFVGTLARRINFEPTIDDTDTFLELLSAAHTQLEAVTHHCSKTSNPLMGAPLRRIQAGINHFDVNPLSWKFVRRGAAADEWRYADAQWVTALKATRGGEEGWRTTGT
ncbi:hypothetical protein Agabi119p4_5649 [Agaricus bisporus var. burnettii]|uniref:Uncharacterized protein n=1 Tax=Agaricus bisporus var. burnettii TaxID=192524 RepID=A0A8H7F252_AGABI|nr:hypothetical protein Agabi119p4_5649 [Agaricus bisporus var. burnettii]